MVPLRGDDIFKGKMNKIKEPLNVRREVVLTPQFESWIEGELRHQMEKAIINIPELSVWGEI